MKLISLLIPESYLKDINRLVKQGHYKSRPELIRMAVRDLLLAHGFAPWPEEIKEKEGSGPRKE